jgi:hypothetical protein
MVGKDINLSLYHFEGFLIIRTQSITSLRFASTSCHNREELSPGLVFQSRNLFSLLLLRHDHGSFCEFLIDVYNLFCIRLEKYVFVNIEITACASYVF